MAKKYVDIAFATAVRRLFTYHTSDKTEVKPGMRVWVPLRKEYAIGMVVQVHQKRPEFETRPIEQVLDEKPIMNTSMLQLTEWIHRFYYCSWGEAVQTALPVGLNFASQKMLKVKKGYKGELTDKEREFLDDIETNSYTLNQGEKRWRDGEGKKLLKKAMKQNWVEVWEMPRQKVDYKKIKHWKLAEGIDPEQAIAGLGENDRSNKWVQAYEKLADMDLPIPHRELLKGKLFTTYTLNRIEEEGWIKSVDLSVKNETINHGEFQPEEIKTLSDQQEDVYREIKAALDAEQFKSFLLFGVTGSGKTEVYIHALKDALEQGRGGLVLVPEIALTPQTVQRFYQIFGDQIAVLHSRLSERERYEAWQSLKSGEKRIAIGPRSAVFAPVQDVG